MQSLSIQKLMLDCSIQPDEELASHWKPYDQKFNLNLCNPYPQLNSFTIYHSNLQKLVIKTLKVQVGTVREIRRKQEIPVSAQVIV